MGPRPFSANAVLTAACDEIHASVELSNGESWPMHLRIEDEDIAPANKVEPGETRRVTVSAMLDARPRAVDHCSQPPGRHPTGAQPRLGPNAGGAVQSS